MPHLRLLSRRDEDSTYVCPCLLGETPDGSDAPYGGAACAICFALVTSERYRFRWCRNDHGMLVAANAGEPRACHLHKEEAA